MATEETATPATAPLAVIAEITVPLERITNCLIGALEGGSTHWLRAVGYTVVPAGEYEKPPYSDPHFWNDGGYMNVHYDDPEGEEGNGDACKNIGLPELKAGLAVMAAKHGRHFGDLIAENDDAITHDVFIQCALMGDVVYG